MARPKKTDGTDETPDFGDRPTLTEGGSYDPETASHNWQSGSPAVDQRDASKPLVNQDNLAARLANVQPGDDEEPAEVEKPVVSKEEYARRSKLDVSSPEYINPSLEHHEVEGQ